MIFAVSSEVNQEIPPMAPNPAMMMRKRETMAMILKMKERRKFLKISSSFVCSEIVFTLRKIRMSPAILIIGPA